MAAVRQHQAEQQLVALSPKFAATGLKATLASVPCGCLDSSTGVLKDGWVRKHSGGNALGRKVTAKDEFDRRWAVLWSHPSPGAVDAAAEVGGYSDHRRWADPEALIRYALLLYRNLGADQPDNVLVISQAARVSAMPVDTKLLKRHPHCFHLQQAAAEGGTQTATAEVDLLFSVDSEEELQQWVGLMRFEQESEKLAGSCILDAGDVSGSTTPNTDQAAQLRCDSPNSSQAQSLDDKSPTSGGLRGKVGKFGRRMSVVGKSATSPQAMSSSGLSTMIAEDTPPTQDAATPEPVAMQGYLMKRGAKNTAFKKRWFCLDHDGQLYYYKSSHTKTPSGQLGVRGAMVLAEQTDHTIKIVTPFEKREYIVQAEDASMMQAWTDTLVVCGAVAVAETQAMAQARMVEANPQATGDVSSGAAMGVACSIESMIMSRGTRRESSQSLNKSGVVGLVRRDGIQNCHLQLRGRSLHISLCTVSVGAGGTGALGEVQEDPEPELEPELSTGLRQKVASKAHGLHEKAKKKLGDTLETEGKDVVLDASKHAVVIVKTDACAFALTSGGSPIFRMVAPSEAVARAWVVCLHAVIEASRPSPGLEAAKALGAYENPVDWQAILADTSSTSVPRLDSAIRPTGKPMVSLSIEVWDSNSKESDAVLAPFDTTQTLLDGRVYCVLYARDDGVLPVPGRTRDGSKSPNRLAAGVAHYPGWAPIFRTEAARRLERLETGAAWTSMCVCFTVGKEYDELRLAVSTEDLDDKVEGQGTLDISLKLIDSEGGKIERTVDTIWRPWKCGEEQLESLDASMESLQDARARVAMASEASESVQFDVAPLVCQLGDCELVSDILSLQIRP